mmetsp:Transcript_49829/g.97479  ORF Transcript_49829/g.97479 Transcript_49829/m.97479 type:complete len:417 (-) Transcript_49829:559-1809(-)|eukprot:CAMPEP_0194336872 /NCGR_PEP_ID=MMETSP0171-20130528/74456_1 /TAXON_ID=218684 /ORGANISM="Corethron pennatum, Strain L29A3" /LENGTH=416 /DNA_ID=CAMNT_0039100453 /DNA_START=299 /DNA_END=1549 /DNA_ORIENTATION=-
MPIASPPIISRGYGSIEPQAWSGTSVRQSSNHPIDDFAVDNLTKTFTDLNNLWKGRRPDGYGQVCAVEEGEEGEMDENGGGPAGGKPSLSAGGFPHPSSADRTKRIPIHLLTMYPAVALTIAPLLAKAGPLTLKQHARRAGTAIAGGTLCVVGSIMAPLPTPGGVIVIGAGMMVLGTEFPAAQKVMDRAVGGLVNVIENDADDGNDKNKNSATANEGGTQNKSEGDQNRIKEEEERTNSVPLSKDESKREATQSEKSEEATPTPRNFESVAKRVNEHRATRMLKTRARSIGRTVFLPVLKHMQNSSGAATGDVMGSFGGSFGAFQARREDSSQSVEDCVQSAQTVEIASSLSKSTAEPDEIPPGLSSVDNESNGGSSHGEKSQQEEEDNRTWIQPPALEDAVGRKATPSKAEVVLV